VGVFLAQWIFREMSLVALLAASSSEIFEDWYVWQLVTAPFLHTDAWHILVNMLFFWFVGREIEAMYGSLDFTLMYLTAAVLSTFGWAVLDYAGPDQGAGYMLGASGAVMAVVVIYALYYPRREVLLFFVLPVPIWLLLVIFLGMDFLQLMNELSGGVSSAGVAFASHLIGAGYGYLYKAYDLRWTHLIGKRPFRPRLRVLTPDPRDRGSAVSPRPSSSGPWIAPSIFYDEEKDQLDERVDQILAKIARQGRGSLTDEENRILQEASRRAQARRSDRV
jgi:membrane associated rhomboid family serine protease